MIATLLLAEAEPKVLVLTLSDKDESHRRVPL